MGVIVKGPWRAPSLPQLVNERKRIDRLIEDTCTERIAALDKEKGASVFQAPSVLRRHEDSTDGLPAVFARKENQPSANGERLELE